MRRFFRFSIRDLLWFVALIAVALASYKYGHAEVMATFEGVTKVTKGGDFYIFEKGEWHYGGRVPPPPTEPPF